MTSTIDYALKDSVGTLTIRRENKHNALGAEELDGIEDVIETVIADPEIRALVVTGEGEKTFCAGAALEDLNSGRITPTRFQAAMERLAAVPVPTIARINGSVFGGGTELALSCDFRIGVRGSRLRVPAAALGLCYPPAGIRRFVERLGANVARRMLVASETLMADELFRIGFLDYLVDETELDDRIDELTMHLAGLAPLAVAAMKELVRDAERGIVDEAREGALAQRCAESADLSEGLAAQKEKRSPRFVGR
jgi:enoyl-CoA hydratase/carnithine racemase